MKQNECLKIWASVPRGTFRNVRNVYAVQYRELKPKNKKMRTSKDIYTTDGSLHMGYDYEKQCWVVGGIAYPDTGDALKALYAHNRK